MFDATVDARNVFGVIVTLSGIFSYTYFKLDDEARAREAKEAEVRAGVLERLCNVIGTEGGSGCCADPNHPAKGGC